jgi:hypothetical protein
MKKFTALIITVCVTLVLLTGSVFATAQSIDGQQQVLIAATFATDTGQASQMMKKDTLKVAASATIKDFTASNLILAEIIYIPVCPQNQLISTSENLGKTDAEKGFLILKLPILVGASSLQKQESLFIADANWPTPDKEKGSGNFVLKLPITEVASFTRMQQV